MRFKKQLIFCVIIVTTLMLNNLYVYAEPVSEFFSNNNIYYASDSDAYAKRKDIIELLCNVKGGLMVGNVEQFTKSNYTHLSSFQDVNDASEEARIVFSAVVFGLLKGRYDENGVIKADLYDNVTLDEAFLFVGRMMDKSDDECKDYLIKNNILTYPLNIEYITENDYITVDDMMKFAYNSLFIEFEMHKYLGIVNCRYIDMI